MAIAVVCGATAYAFLARPGFSSDFFHVWAGARALLNGENPYTATPPYAVNTGHYLLFYPLPALIAVLPLALLPLPVAGGVFIALSSGVLAYVISRDGYARLPLFMSAPFLMAVSLGQWSPLLTAAALEPAIGFVFAAKPNIGLAGWIYRPSRAAIIGATILVAISFFILPTWPLDWLRSVVGRPEKAFPIRTTFGAILLLALIRWRKPEARLFMAMACVPQALFFYDQLPLWLIPRTLKQSLLVSLASFGVFLTWFHRIRPGQLYVQEAMPYATALYFIFLPLVLWPERPHFPHWLRRMLVGSSKAVRDAGV